jgi:hypothetical protein
MVWPPENFVKIVTSGAVVDLRSVKAHWRHCRNSEDHHMTGFPTVVRSRLRFWSVATLVLGTVLAGTALAVAGTDRKSDEYGEMGASPVPVAGAVTGPTKFRVSSFNVLGYDHTAKGGQKKGYANGAVRMKWGVQLLKSHQVDVVGLQEFQPQQYAKWARKASGLYDIFPGYIDTIGFLRNSIAWRKDRFRLVSTSWLKLPYFHGDVLRMPVVLLQSLQKGQQQPADRVDRGHERQAAGVLPGHQAGRDDLGQRWLPQRRDLPDSARHGRGLDLRLAGAVHQLRPGPQQEGRADHRPPHAGRRRARPARRAGDPAAADSDRPADDRPADDRPADDADAEPVAGHTRRVIQPTADLVNDR